MPGMSYNINIEVPGKKGSKMNNNIPGSSRYCHINTLALHHHNNIQFTVKKDRFRLYNYNKRTR